MKKQTPGSSKQRSSEENIPEKPELRPVEVFPAIVDQKQVVCLKDPEGFAKDVLMFSEKVTPIISQMDGTRTIEDISTNMAQYTEGKPIPVQVIQELVQTLNMNFFLNSSRFQQEKEQQIQTFQNQDIREPASAGEAYPDDSEECASYLEDILHLHDSGEDMTLSSGDFCGFMAPHIDLQRGKETYAKTYAPLRGNLPEDALFVVLGTSHAPVQSQLVPTTKDYRTPVGTVPTDTELSQMMIDQLPADFEQDEFRHRTEHSIEFQALFLAHLLGEKRSNARLLPILCRSFETSAQMTEPKSTDQMVKEARKGRQILRRVLRHTDRPIVWVAGVDLAHVGIRFGDQEETTQETLEWLEEEDRETLSHCEEINPRDFLDHVARNDEKRKICGTSPIFHLLQSSEPERGELIEYRQAADLEAETTVSFAGMYFYR